MATHLSGGLQAVENGVALLLAADFVILAALRLRLDSRNPGLILSLQPPSCFGLRTHPLTLASSLWTAVWCTPSEALEDCEDASLR